MAKHPLAKPLFPHLKYCTRCCVPETQEGIRFDDMGICQACQSSEQKIHISWAQRGQQLGNILDEARSRASNNYDCIIPISGGKDSAYQLHVLTKIYRLKPLAVTFSHNWWSESGWYNLQNALETFNVDHVMFTPSRDLINRIVRNSVERIGDTSWHDHAGVGAFPLRIAVDWEIPLLIWGESLAENSGRATYLDPVHKFDRDYFLKQSGKLAPEQMIGGAVTARDLYPFELPTVEEMERIGVWGIHLGDYLFWDDERQTEFLHDMYGWREAEMENTYKRYKSVEDIMSGMHDFTCYLKRGFSRTTEQSSIDVRNGLLTRDEAFVLIQEHEPERPEALDYYLAITGSTEEEFYAAMDRLRLPQMKGVDIPVKQKNHKNTERLLPFPEQLVQKFNKSDAKRHYL